MKWQNAMLKDMIRLEKLEKERTDIIEILNNGYTEVSGRIGLQHFSAGMKLARERVFTRLGEKIS